METSSSIAQNTANVMPTATSTETDNRTDVRIAFGDLQEIQTSS